ncbi:MAG: T3SS (YopN, CesT) and YbjN peptide-binding chaperone 1 [Dietzia sp.]
MDARRSEPDHASLRPVDDPWGRFEQALARHLERPSAMGAMELSAPADSTGQRARCVVQLAADDSLAWVTFRAARHPLIEEIVARTSPTVAGTVARAVVDACRDRMGLPHPQLLTTRCEGPVGRHVEGLGLVRSDSLAVGSDPADHPDPVDVAVEVDGHEDARDRVEAIVERITGRPTIVDDHGDLVFDHVGHPVHVSFSADDPTARIWAWVVRGVRSRSDTAVELGRINRDEDWTSWILDGRHVKQRSVVSVGPFLPRHVQFALEHFLLTFATTRDGIAARLGPR